jgi:phenylacetate-coenzyme A ligase PaaK-like adenylate-forming protein
MRLRSFGLLNPGAVERSQGKARRVVDKRAMP